MKYEKIKYPDGQISVKITDFSESIIKERINSYEDLFFIRAISESYSANRVLKNLRLLIPCMFSQRSDRRFDGAQSFDLKIICEFINSCNFTSVGVLDPHSDVTLALLNNSHKISSLPYVEKAVTDLGKDNLVLVSPDAGAYKKVFEYGKELNLPVVAANKFRDKDGKISLMFMGDVKGKKCLIVDDLCDGGYTFYLLAKALREQGAASVYLYVSHGYFSKGFFTRLDKDVPNSSLRNCLDGIYCTNSVKDVTTEYFDSYNMKTLGNFVKQFKVI